MGNRRPSAEGIERAVERVREVAYETPLLPWGERGLYVKLESLQRTGSFKIRGAWNRMSRASPEEKRRGFVTVSAGNHGLAVAEGARILGSECVVWAPEGASPRKVEAIRKIGGKVHFLPHEKIMDSLRTPDFPLDRERTFVHPFGDVDVIEGQGTVGFEIQRALPKVGSVVVPVAGGGLAVGIGTILSPQTQIVGVQAEGAQPLRESFRRGEPASVGRPRTIADGIAVSSVFDFMWEPLSRILSDVVVVSDSEITNAMRLLARDLRVVVEPAGAASVAAALREIDRLPLPVVAVASGGNVDPLLFSRILSEGEGGEI